MKVAIIAALLVVTWASPALAGPEDVANRMAGEIMSPFCPGVTLHDCPSGEADDLRAQIRDWSAAGWGEERIMAELVDEYGPGVRAVPPAEGGGLGAWVLPGLAVVGGLGAAALLARRWVAGRMDTAGTSWPAAGPTPEQRTRLATELRAHEDLITGTPRTPGSKAR
jgi:cytochrome c-type biogenesis protein CcmH/NrfF